MTSLFNSLAEISSEYTVFEKDQILTEAQLNGLSSYLDDQDRLSRTNLIGVGVICGLRAGLAANVVTVGKGVGITTDGDLIRIAADTAFDHYKIYDEQFPSYPPLYVDASTMLTVYELVETDYDDPLASELSGFEAATGSALADMVVVLLMESYIKDHDLCSGTDCDNHSQIYHSKVKALLVDKADIGALTPVISTAAAAALALNPLTADRVTLSGSVTTPAQLAQRYRTACDNMHNRLVSALPTLWTHAGFLLGNTFSGDPTSGWISALNTLKNKFAAEDDHIQSYYDFLKDVIETWNVMRDALFTETAWCCPDPDGFPKHLLLGDLVPGTDIDANRMDFYPSAAISRGDGIKHALFLVEKLGALIDNFDIPSSTTIKVTPSSSALKPLEQRAIPWYYSLASGSNVLERWNFTLHQRDMDRYNFSYHAAGYNALGPAADPLNSAIDQNDFFRVEGHIGQQVGSVTSAIESLIAQYNLPFTVLPVLLGTSAGNLVNKKGAGYTDLNRLHYLIRKDIYYRLDDVSTFGGSYKAQIDQAVDSGKVKNDVTGNDGSPVKTIAANKNSTVSQKSKAAQDKLDQGYTVYKTDPSWRTDVNDVMIAASQFKYELGKVSKTEFVTPFDGLIADTKVDWLGWIDVLIEDKDEQADAKKLFANFLKEFPGFEHIGGVPRGGTLVLLYNSSGKVIGDGMLPHYYKEHIEAATPEPPLTRPSYPKDWLDYGVQIYPSWDNYVQGKLDIFKVNLDDEWKKKFDIGTLYADVFKDSVTIIGDIYKQSGTRMTGDGFVLPGDEYKQYEDDILRGHAFGIDAQMEKIRLYEQSLQDTTLPADQRNFLEAELDKAQQELGHNIEATAEYLSMKNTDVKTGTEGAAIIGKMNTGVNAIAGNNKVHQQTFERLNNIKGSTPNADLAVKIGVMFGN